MIMNEKQMSFEDVRAVIKRMCAELVELEKLLKESVWKEETKWPFPEGNYTVLAIWLLYDPRAHEVFPVNGRKSWVELAERLTKYVGWVVDWHTLRKNYTRKDLKK